MKVTIPSMGLVGGFNGCGTAAIFPTRYVVVDIVCVTGANGKTTATCLIEHLFCERYARFSAKTDGMLGVTNKRISRRTVGAAREGSMKATTHAPAIITNFWHHSLGGSSPLFFALFTLLLGVTLNNHSLFLLENLAMPHTHSAGAATESVAVPKPQRRAVLTATPNVVGTESPPVDNPPTPHPAGTVAESAAVPKPQRRAVLTTALVAATNLVETGSPAADHPRPSGGLDDVSIRNCGPAVRTARLRSGKSLRQVAKHVGKTPGWLSQVERGRIQVSPESLGKLASAIGTTPDGIRAGVSAAGPQTIPLSSDLLIQFLGIINHREKRIKELEEELLRLETAELPDPDEQILIGLQMRALLLRNADLCEFAGQAPLAGRARDVADQILSQCKFILASTTPEKLKTLRLLTEKVEFLDMPQGKTTTDA